MANTPSSQQENPSPESSSEKFWIGFDLGGTKMMAVVYDQSQNVVGRAKKKTKGYEGAEAGLKKIAVVIRDAMGEANVQTEQLGGIGIGCPGPLDIAAGIMKSAPNLGWTNVPIREFLEKEFSCQAVVLNDVDSGVYGEYTFGAGKDSRCLVGIFPGTGIGGGCIYKGEIFQGLNHTCMEVGHIPLISNSLPDGCGNQGTLEAVASRLTIAAGAAQAVYRGQAPALFKKSGTNLSDIRSGALKHSVESGDQAVIDLVKQAGQYLGLGIVTMVHLLSPDRIVMGGGLAEALPELLVGTAEKYAKQRVMESYRDTFEVVVASLGDDSAAAGAAAWAKKTFE